LPNFAYEFGIHAVNPATTPNPNFWGLVFRNERNEVADSSMTIDGYDLTDYNVVVHSLLASTTVPAVVNYITITVAFQKTLAAGVIGHIRIVAPTTTKILCQQFMDKSGGGSSVAQLPLDPTKGLHGTHDCGDQYSITLHVKADEPIRASSYTIRIGVLNPGIKPVSDYWALDLLAGPASVAIAAKAGATVSGTGNGSMMNGTSGVTATAASNGSTAASTLDWDSWRSQSPVLQIRVAGFGISSAFIGPTVLPIPEVSGALVIPLASSLLSLMFGVHIGFLEFDAC
jgi:hypothetical protein